ncbi:MAG: substrate-binding domain-containing protein [Chloroflexota bacterium]
MEASPPPTRTPTSTRTSTPKRTPTSTVLFRSAYLAEHPVVKEFPRLASSTSAYPLWVMTFCQLFDVPCAWYYNTLRPESAYERSEQFQSMINDHMVVQGTHEAYTALINDEADIILVARPPSADELAAARQKGMAFDLSPVALDAFVFIVHVNNPVDNLTIQQIQGIYTGQIHNWAEVGGQDAKINAYQREANSGSQELMQDLVMKGLRMIEAPDMIRYSMAGPFNVIGGYPYTPGDVFGIGYSVYYYARNMIESDNVEFVGVNGVEPARSTIATRSYPLTTEVYVVIREGLWTGSAAVIVRDWFFTRDGRSAISLSGYVPIPEE